MPAAKRVDIEPTTRHNSPVPAPRRVSRTRTTLARLICTSPWLLAGVSAAQTTPDFVDQQRRLVDLHVRPLVTTWVEATDAPGGVMVVVEGDQPLLVESFGFADVEHRFPVDPSTTVFQAGELARLMTATALLRLADHSALSLESDLSGRADFHFLGLRGTFPLTAEQLLLHTAGFDQRSVASRARSLDELEPLAEYLHRRMPPRVRAPGVVSIPSAHDYSLAGLLIEASTETRFAEAVDHWVFQPFAMSRTTADPLRETDRSVATGYHRLGPQLREAPVDYPQTIPASFLLTTGTDMSRWLRAVLGSDRSSETRLLSRESRERLLTTQFRHHPSLPGRTLALREGSRFSPSELYLAARGGGYSALVMLLPQRRVGLFFAFNSEVDFWDLAYAILDTFEPTPAASVSPTSSSAAGALRSVEGYWQDAVVSTSTPEKLLSLVRQDRLARQPDDALTWRARHYRPVSTDEIREIDGDGILCFLGEGKRPRFAASRAVVVERLAWHRSRPIQIVLWIVFGASFLAIGWPRPALPGRLPTLLPEDSFRPRWPSAVVRLAATLHFLFLTGLAVLLATHLRWQRPVLLYQIPVPVYLTLSLPLVAAALTPVAVIGTVLAWRSPHWSRKGRLGLALSTLALLLFLPFLWSWNLLGFRL